MWKVYKDITDSADCVQNILRDSSEVLDRIK